MGVSINGGTQQPLVFLLKMIILGCEMGVPLFSETSVWAWGFYKLQMQAETILGIFMWNLT